MDVHRNNVAAVLGISPEQVTPSQRAFAKLVAFGAPSAGAMRECLKIALQLARAASKAGDDE